MIRFDCEGFYDRSREKWQGYISRLVYSGNHMEISIMLSQIITADVCKSTSGYFVYFPCYENGVNLDSLFFTDENSGRLAAIFGEKDASTVAHAIRKVAHIIAKPRKKRKSVISCADNELPF